MCASKIMQDAEVARQQGNEHFKASCKFPSAAGHHRNVFAADHQAGRVPEALAHYVPWFATLCERGYWLDVEIWATFFHRKRAWSYWRCNLKCLPAVLPRCWAMLSLGHFYGCWEENCNWRMRIWRLFTMGLLNIPRKTTWLTHYLTSSLHV